MITYWVIFSCDQS